MSAHKKSIGHIITMCMAGDPLVLIHSRFNGLELYIYARKHSEITDLRSIHLLYA